MLYSPWAIFQKLGVVLLQGSKLRTDETLRYHGLLNRWIGDGLVLEPVGLLEDFLGQEWSRYVKIEFGELSGLRTFSAQ